MRLDKIVWVLLTTVTLLSATSEKYVKVNFRNLDIKDFVEMVSKISKKNILINDTLKGKINFVSTQPIKKTSLIPLANSILQNKGYTLVDQGDFMQIVKASDAAGMGLAVDDKISGNTLKTVLFRLKSSNAAVIRAKIKPLLHKNAKVISFKNNNVLSITAYPRTLRSIKLIIDSVEKAGKKGSTVIKLKNSSAKAVYSNAVKMAAQLFPKSIPSEKVDILQDQGTNSIILVGKKENVTKMIKYIKQLDRKGESVEQKMYVIPLKNSNVEEMEKILSKLVSQMNGMASSAVKKGGKPPKKAMVVGDSERNALIILATGDQIKNIRQVIRRIDIPKVQVYVKARIVEINRNLASQIGIRYGFEGGQITSNGLFTAAANMGASSSLMVSSTLLGFLDSTKTTYDSNGNPITDTTRPFKFDGDISKVFALGAKLDLLKQNGAAHILSEPSILCTNNKKASIYVGRTQSILTKAQQSTSGQANIVNSYSREDIGLTLNVKPRLSSNNQVSLEIEAIIEDILPGSGSSADRPTTTKRKVNTNAIVNNGETIILGGLVKNANGESVSKVPILGDIPIIGELFKSTGNAESSVNVVIYLTPYIVRRSSDLKRLRKSLEELERVQRKYNNLVRKGLEGESQKSYGNSHRSSEPDDAMSAFGFKKHRSKRSTPSAVKRVEEKPVKKEKPVETTPDPVNTPPKKRSSAMDLLRMR